MDNKGSKKGIGIITRRMELGDKVRGGKADYSIIYAINLICNLGVAKERIFETRRAKKPRWGFLIFFT